MKKLKLMIILFTAIMVEASLVVKPSAYAKAESGSESGIEIHFFYDSNPCSCHPEEKKANEIALLALSEARGDGRFKVLEVDTDKFEGAEKFDSYRAAYGGLFKTPVMFIGNDFIVRFKSKDETVKEILALTEKYVNEGFYPNPSEILNLSKQIKTIESAVRKNPEARDFLEKAVLTRKQFHISKDSVNIKWFSYIGVLEAELTRDLKLLKVSAERNIVDETEKAKTNHITQSIPLGKRINLSSLNLPAITILIAAADSFNPCVIFVLLFLLSMMLNLRSRSKILMVGMLFILVTGIFYFLFMAALLNIFFLVDLVHVSYVKSIVGAVAVIIGIINMKDFFFFKKGVSLTITDAKRNRLFSKMYNLFSKPGAKSIVPGTVGLALFANLIEVPCTGGFPPVYTTLLKMNTMHPFKYYLYLLMYNFIYVLPELIIVAVTAFTLGTKEFTEKHGRILKMVSGIILFGLGFILIYS